MKGKIMLHAMLTLANILVSLGLIAHAGYVAYDFVKKCSDLMNSGRSFSWSFNYAFNQYPSIMYPAYLCEVITAFYCVQWIACS